MYLIPHYLNIDDPIMFKPEICGTHVNLLNKVNSVFPLQYARPTPCYAPTSPHHLTLCLIVLFLGGQHDSLFLAFEFITSNVIGMIRVLLN